MADSSRQDDENKPRRSQSADYNSKRSRLPKQSPRPHINPNSFRFNKLYRGPPTPPPETLFDKEQSFVLDCRAVSHISNDYSIANPKLGSVIPPYNSQKDSDVDNYFHFYGVDNTLRRTGQLSNHESLAGRVHDRFFTSGHAFKYLSLRNKFGSGHSIDEVRGHELFLSNPKPVLNYNGLFGYRRNTPSLRVQPAIGVKTIRIEEIVPFSRFTKIGCNKPYPFHCRCPPGGKVCRCHNGNSLCQCVKA